MRLVDKDGNETDYELIEWGPGGVWGFEELRRDVVQRLPDYEGHDVSMGFDNQPRIAYNDIPLEVVEGFVERGLIAEYTGSVLRRLTSCGGTPTHGSMRRPSAASTRRPAGMPSSGACGSRRRSRLQRTWQRVRTCRGRSCSRPTGPPALAVLHGCLVREWYGERRRLRLVRRLICGSGAGP